MMVIKEMHIDDQYFRQIEQSKPSDNEPPLVKVCHIDFKTTLSAFASGQIGSIIDRS